MSLTLLRAGKAGAFTPADLPNLVTWIEASDLALNNNDPISAWGPFTQTLTSRPLYIANVLNGWPVARFDGSNDYMAAGDIGMGLSGLSVGAVVKTTGVQAQHQMVVAKSVLTSSLNGWRLYLQSVDGWHSFRAGNAGSSVIWHATADIGVFDTNFHILYGSFAIGSQQLWRDGTLLHSPTGVTAHDTNTTALTIGGGGAGGERLFGDIAGLVVCGGTLSVGNRDSLKNFWANKYALTVA